MPGAGTWMKMLFAYAARSRHVLALLTCFQWRCVVCRRPSIRVLRNTYGRGTVQGVFDSSPPGLSSMRREPSLRKCISNMPSCVPSSTRKTSSKVAPLVKCHTDVTLSSDITPTCSGAHCRIGPRIRKSSTTSSTDYGRLPSPTNPSGAPSRRLSSRGGRIRRQPQSRGGPLQAPSWRG